MIDEQHGLLHVIGEVLHAERHRQRVRARRGGHIGTRAAALTLAAVGEGLHRFA